MKDDIKVGVFVPKDSQLLDLACVDVLATMSREYLGVIPFMPEHVVAIAPSLSIYYITTPAQEQGIPLTASGVLKATHVYTDEAVGPGKLDIIIVPGPNPESTFEEAGLEWLKRHAATEGVDILGVCTGIYICASAGIVDGKVASGPRGVQDDLMNKFPNIKLVGDKQRWARDGNFWSSGGVTNGNDLMVAYARQSGRWSQAVVDIGVMMTDISERGQFYEEGNPIFIAGVAWKLVKAWFASLWPGKKKAA